jgi:hypothetical protein
MIAPAAILEELRRRDEEEGQEDADVCESP